MRRNHTAHLSRWLACCGDARACIFSSTHGVGMCLGLAQRSIDIASCRAHERIQSLGRYVLIILGCEGLFSHSFIFIYTRTVIREMLCKAPRSPEVALELQPPRARAVALMCSRTPAQTLRSNGDNVLNLRSACRSRERHTYYLNVTFKVKLR